MSESSNRDLESFFCLLRMLHAVAPFILPETEGENRLRDGGAGTPGWCPQRCPEEGAVGEASAAMSQAPAQRALGTVGCFGATSRKEVFE